MNDDHHGIPLLAVAEQLDDLISNARQSVMLASPLDAAEALPTVPLTIVSQAPARGAQCFLCLRLAPGTKAPAALPEIVKFYEQFGWRTRVCVVPAYNDGYLVVDDYYGMVFTNDGRVDLTMRESDVEPLRAHFHTEWMHADVPSRYEALYEDLVQPSRPELILPFVEEQQYWDKLILRLALNPADLESIEPRDFERLVAELLRRDGYSDVTLTSQTRDGGFDIFAVTDTALGRHMYLVECKRYKQDNPVGVSLVRNLYGVMEAERATKALLVTTSYFTKDATTFQQRAPHRLALTDYERLVRWLRRVNG